MYPHLNLLPLKPSKPQNWFVLIETFWSSHRISSFHLLTGLVDSQSAELLIRKVGLGLLSHGVGLFRIINNIIKWNHFHLYSQCHCRNHHNVITAIFIVIIIIFFITTTTMINTNRWPDTVQLLSPLPQCDRHHCQPHQDYHHHQWQVTGYCPTIVTSPTSVYKQLLPLLYRC